jgi:translation initiation factor IF-2
MMQAEQAELAQQKVLKVTEFITANELSTLMNIPVTQIISTCMSVGLFVSINQRLSAETISLLAEEFGYEVEFVGVDDNENNKEEADADKPEDLQPRHPIITVMGHVDHGKTSLLDYIRKSNVIAGEAGGITQHIGAYEVTLADGRKITFLDTPGHEAFTAMRARGARITDLCIIVIAADDSIMPQTVEAINHAQAAGVPMVFAITKIDKPHAAPDKIREGLANMNILVEEWGGKYQCQEIDAKHGTNVNELLEKVLLEAEMLDLKANPNRPGVGTVIESSLDKGKGYVAKLLVQNGTLKIGDPILAGSCYGKVKALFNERNQPVKSVGPASPVLLLGLDGAPQAGDTFKVCDSEQEARSTATKRARLLREQGLRTQKHITLDEIGRRIAIGDFKELNVIVKGDVDGSVEALSDSLMKLSTDKIQVNVIHKSVGQVTESDVMLASASDAVIVAFQVRPSIGARKEAEKEQIDIRTYSIIYDAIEEIKAAMESMLAPQIREKVVANLEIKEVFKIGKVGNVAGCMVLDGKLQRNTKVRLIRDGIVIYTGKLGSLRRFKDDVKEVVSGQDCGLNIENYNDIKVGDIIEGYEEYEEKATL